MTKDAFIIYTSFYKPISLLSDKQLGRLFRAIFKYNLGEIVNVEDDIRMAFEFFKNQFEIDERKYQDKINRDVENGRKGGNPNFKKGQSNPYAKRGKKITQDNPPITQDNPGLCEDNPTITPDNPSITPDNPINDNDNDKYSSSSSSCTCARENGEVTDVTNNDAKFVESMCKAQGWIEMLAMRYHMTADNLKQALHDFHTDCVCRGTSGHKTLAEFKQHFNNWMLIRQRVELEQQKHGHRQGNGAASTAEQRRNDAAELVAELLAKDDG